MSCVSAMSPILDDVYGRVRATYPPIGIRYKLSEG